MHLLDSVHLGEARVDDALGHLRLARRPAATRGHQAVEFVDEDDRRRDGSRALEQARETPLDRALPFRQYVRRFDRYEVGVGSPRRRIAHPGLPKRTRREYDV